MTKVKDKLKKDKREYKHRVNEYNRDTENIIIENELTVSDTLELNLTKTLQRGSVALIIIKLQKLINHYYPTKEHNVR